MAATLRVHSVLYGNDRGHFGRSVQALARSVALARHEGAVAGAVLSLGDCSPQPVLTEKDLVELRADNPDLSGIEYVFFDANLGSAAGQNRLMEGFDADFLLILNPDTIIAPNALVEMFKAFVTQPMVGIVEARQLPFEHPKSYDPVSGVTSWASTACALVPRVVIERVGGFDSDTFFLYCDDVDWSWRIRLAGFTIVLRDSARVFHDKRLTPSGRWIVSRAEEFYSAEAALLMAHKWGRPDLVQRYLSDFEKSDSKRQREAAASYRQRQREKRLPVPVVGADRVATFVKGAYATHRY